MKLECPKCKSTVLIDAERTVRAPGAFDGFDMKYCYCGSYLEVKKGGELKPWPARKGTEGYKPPDGRGRGKEVGVAQKRFYPKPSFKDEDEEAFQ